MTTVFDNNYLYGDGYRVYESIAFFEKIPLDPYRLQFCEWLRFHSIDPNDVPIHSRVVRSVSHCMVQYTTIDREIPSPPRLGFVYKKSQPMNGNKPFVLLRPENSTDESNWEFSTHIETIKSETPPLPFPGFGFEKALYKIKNSSRF